MEDLISIQAVLDYIDKMPSELTADGRRMIRRRTLEEYISDTLPPVNPKQNDVLGKIRAEIADLDDADYYHEGYYKAVTDAMKIIDKYKAESEDVK